MRQFGRAAAIGLVWAMAVGAPLPVAADLLSTGDQAIYRAAFAAIEAEDWEKARELAATAEEPLPAKLVQWLDLIRPGPGRSFDEVSAFLRDNGDWPGQISLQEQAERAFPAAMGADETIAWFEGRAPQTIEGAMALGDALIARGRAEDGARILREGYVALPMDSNEDAVFMDRFGSLLKAEDHIARLDRLLWERETEAARRAAARVDAGHRALAEARIALITGAGNLDAAIANVPESLLRDPGLVYDRARWRRLKEDYAGAAEMLDPPPEGAYDPAKMWKELEIAARRALDRGDISVAYRLAAGHGAADGSVFADGEWLAGWIALRFLQERQIGYDHFTRLYAGVSSAISKGRAAYWAGRAAEELGELDLARNWYAKAAENLATYYGQLAAQRLGTSAGLAFPTLPPTTDAERQAFAAREQVRLIRMMSEIGELDRMRSFFLRMAEKAENATDHHLLVDLASELERPDYMVAAAKIARQNGVELIDYLYPMQTLPDGIVPEPALVLGVIRQESAFDRKAESSAGALGLMQLLPGTAKDVAKKLGLEYSKSGLTEDPVYNVRLGRAYLAELIDRFGGSYVLAIAGYNAGPARVREWMAEYGDPRVRGIDVVDWIETIPFSETRNYVQRVLENLQIYRYRLDGETAIALSLEQDLARDAIP